ncbi:MAG: TasA family protein [Oscillospiraceae bacterium]|nr:TasA family protein [Oscillospiraceae bacterium]
MKKKRFLLIALACVLTALLAGGTLAWMAASKQADNSFTIGLTDAKVDETFRPGKLIPGTDFTKRVRVQNANTLGKAVDAYIRVALIPTWRDEDGNGLPYSALEGEYAVTLNLSASEKWQRSGEYYYFIEAVAPDAYTDYLLESVNAAAAPAGAHLEIQILADSIQVEGGAAQAAWGPSIPDALKSQA